MSAANQLDLVFIVDNTGSMGGFIREAKLQLAEAVSKLSSSRSVDLQIGLVKYRDYFKADKYVTKKYDLTSDVSKVQESIKGMEPEGGGDGPEAVYEAVKVACLEMSWRRSAQRFALLVGDAPPHGFGLWSRENLGQTFAVNDSYGDGCPSKLNPYSISALCETSGMVVHAIALGGHPSTVSSFAEISQRTGGEVHSSGTRAVDVILKALGSQIDKLDFDRKVFELVERELSKGTSKEDLAKAAKEELGLGASASILRLTSRNLI